MKKKYFLLVVVLLLGTGYLLWQLSRSRTFQFFGAIIPRVTTTEKVVAMTFDDGPVPQATDQILSYLAQGEVRATFFVTGAELAQHLSEGQKLVAAGHELGNHSYSHTRMILSSPSFVRSEIERTDELIRAAGYQGEITFRPPFGKKLFTLPYYLSQAGRKTITWDVEPDSYPEIAASADKITEHVLAQTQPGSIIILHVMYSSRRESLKAVPQIIRGLKEQGYSFKTVSELLTLEQ